MEQGLLIKDFAKKLGVTEDTVINWEIRGRVPRLKSHILRLSRAVPEVERFFASLIWKEELIKEEGDVVD